MKHPRSNKKYKVAFAKEPFEFEVKSDDVRGSIVADSENCAAACALKHLPGIDQAWVNRTTTTIKFADDHPEHPGKILRWRNPKVLQRGVEGFDTTAGLFPPGGYRLQPVPPSMRKQHDPNIKRSKKRNKVSSRKRPTYALR